MTFRYLLTNEILLLVSPTYFPATTVLTAGGPMLQAELLQKLRGLFGIS